MGGKSERRLLGPLVMFAWASVAVVFTLFVATYWTLADSLFSSVFAVLAVCLFAFMAALSIAALIWERRIGPALAAVALLCAIQFAPTPGFPLMYVDLIVKRAAAENVVASIAQRDPDQPLEGMLTLSVQDRWLVDSDRVFLDGDGQCFAVFFPTQYVDGDWLYGLLHAPSCFDPNEFHYGPWRMTGWRYVEHLHGDWYWIGS